MRIKRKKSINIRQHIKKITALICLLCFIAVFLVSAIHFTANAGFAGQAASPCQRTLMPECRCETGITQLRLTVQTHVHNDSHVDCFICVIVHKIVDQTRQMSTAAVDIILSNTGIMAFTGSLILFMLAVFYTPVELKTRTNN